MLKYLTKRFLRDNWVKIGNYYFQEHEGSLSVMKYQDFEKYGDKLYSLQGDLIQYESNPVDTPINVFEALDDFKRQGLNIQLAPYQLDLLILGVCFEDMFKIVENSSLIDENTINQYNNYRFSSKRRPTKRQSLSKSLRYDVLKRDNFRCQLCGRTSQDGVKLEIDHIIPISKGGTDDISNLQTLCFDCNRGKSNKLM